MTLGLVPLRSLRTDLAVVLDPIAFPPFFVRITTHHTDIVNVRARIVVLLERVDVTSFSTPVSVHTPHPQPDLQTVVTRT